MAAGAGFAHNLLLELLGIFQPLLELLVVAVVKRSGRAGEKLTSDGTAADDVWS